MSMRAVKCILIRHGITPGNEKRIFLGCRTDDSLSGTGVAMTLERRRALLELAGESPVVFASPMKRAMQTARLIFEDADIRIVNDLQEIDFGRFDGHTHEELDGDDAYQAWLDSNGHAPIPEGEDMAGFADRSMRGLRHVLTDVPDGRNAVIVCHGGNIMAIMSMLDGGEYYEYLQENLGGYVLELSVDDDQIHLITYVSIADRLRA